MPHCPSAQPVSHAQNPTYARSNATKFAVIFNSPHARLVSEASDVSAMCRLWLVDLELPCRPLQDPSVRRRTFQEFNPDQECKFSYLLQIIQIHRPGSLLT